MRLLKLKLFNFRPFAGQQTIDVGEDLIALIGPNEAGKSSVLAAFELVGSGQAPELKDTTRGEDSPASLTALYLLDEDDQQSIAEIQGGAQVQRAHVTWTAGRSRPRWKLEPRPSRDLSPRKASSQRVQTILDLAILKDLDEDEWDTSLVDAAVAALECEDDALSEDNLTAIKSLSQQLSNLSSTLEMGESDVPDSVTARIAEVGEELKELLAQERAEAPAQQVIKVLAERLPPVAAFKEQDRVLHREYDLQEVTGDEQPPPALENLCALAGIDLQQVARLLDEGQQPQVEHIFESANARLKERFTADWKQSDVYPRLSAPLDGELRVMIATEDHAGYSFPEERSDGLRWFLALEAFLSAKGIGHPILIVDEAETHLHYDAQADLIDALMNQRVAVQVVYTTHSVGCLPPDLGQGIRAILPRSRSQTSVIANSYWSINPEGELRVGDAPVLFAMGARMLSLTIPRHGVIVEGPSDAVLLPTLLRVATGHGFLGYRVVPGLSEVPRERLPELAGVAGTVAYLTDGDSAGASLLQQLADAGAPHEQLLSLSSIVADCTVEDLVHAEVFAAAINDELRIWSLTDDYVDANAVPIVGRWRWLADEHLPGGIAQRLSKVRVAQKMVEQLKEDSPDRSVLYADALCELNSNLRQVLDVAGAWEPRSDD